MLLLFTSYTSPLISRKLMLVDVTTEQEVHFSELALGRTLVTSTCLCLFTLLSWLKLAAWIT